MNMVKFVSKIGFAIILLALSFSAEGFAKIAEYVVAAIIAFAAIVLLFENKSSKQIWKSIVNWAESLDVTYIVFGLGLILVSSQFSSSFWAILLLLVSGAVFAGTGVAKLIGESGSKIVKTNPKIGITLGCVFLILGIIMCIFTWDSIVERPTLNVASPIVMIGVGIIFIYFGCVNWLKSRSTNQNESRG